MNATAKAPSTGKTVAQLNEELTALALQVIQKKGDERKAVLAQIDDKEKEIEGVVEKYGSAKAQVESLIEMYGFKLSELSDATRQILGAESTSTAKTPKKSRAAGGSRTPAAAIIKNPKDSTKTFSWIRDMTDKALKAELFADFKAGKSVADYVVDGAEKEKVASLIARLERETADVKDGKVSKSYAYSDANLKALDLTRADVAAAEAAYKKAKAATEKSKAKKS